MREEEEKKIEGVEKDRRRIGEGEKEKGVNGRRGKWRKWVRGREEEKKVEEIEKDRRRTWGGRGKN